MYVLRVLFLIAWAAVFDGVTQAAPTSTVALSGTVYSPTSGQSFDIQLHSDGTWQEMFFGNNGTWTWLAGPGVLVLHEVGGVVYAGWWDGGCVEGEWFDAQGWAGTWSACY